jgi:two-component system, OmpR family, phosphate regulon sensor histidine kinase PhoR
MRNLRMIWRLYLPYLLITLVSLLALGWFAFQSMREFYLDQTAADLKMKCELLTPELVALLAAGDADSAIRMCAQVSPRLEARVTLILSSGRVIYDSDENQEVMDNHADRAEVMDAMNGKVGMSIRFSHTLGTDMMYLGTPLTVNGNITGVLRVSKSLIAIEQTLVSMSGKLLAGVIFVALLAAAVTLFISRRISLPLEKLKLGAERYAKGDLQHQLPVPGTPEIRALAEAMNLMARQLDNRIQTIVQQRNELESLLSGMTEGVIAVDTDRRVIWLNRAAGLILGVHPDASRDRFIQEIVRNSCLVEFIDKLIHERQPLEEEIVLHDSDGERIFRTYGVILQDRQQSGVLVVLNNITELRRLENIRTDFVTNVSHELKTPITSIKGFIETLLDGAMDDRENYERFLKIISKQTDRLQAIIEDLLSLSRIEQDKAEIALEEHALTGILKSAIQFCQPPAQSNNIRLDLHCPDDVLVMANAPLLEQAVMNLIDNSIKFSEPGNSVLIEASIDDSDLVISVSDQGCGIEAQHLPRLFERFYRVDKARSRQSGGTGLGLAIVKHIAQVHHGMVDVQSTPGQGSVFTVKLPLK